MDFNTGSGGGSGGGGSSGGAGVPPRPRVSGGATGGDFNLGDPVQSFISTTRELVTNPVGFFRSLPRQGSLGPPLAFALIAVEITFAIVGLLAVIFAVAAGARSIGGAIISLILFLIVPVILATIALFIAAGIYHLVVIFVVRPVGSGFPATFRAIAYPSVLSLVTIISTILNIIPFLGPILSLLISIVVAIAAVVFNVLGIRELHATTTGRAIAVVVIPVVAFAILGLIFSFIVAAIVAAVLSGLSQ